MKQSLFILLAVTVVYGTAFSQSKPLAKHRVDTTFYPAVNTVTQKMGFIDYYGNTVLDFKYQYCNAFEYGVARVRLGNGTTGLINRKGELLSDDDFISYKDGMRRVSLHGKYGFIDTFGKVVVPCMYEKAGYFSEGFAAVRNRKSGFINRKGREITELKYDWVWEFHEGLASVCINDKWGYIDKTGQLKIPFVSEAAGEFSEGVAEVLKGNKWGFINKSGKVVIDYLYDSVRSFSSGLCPVKKSGGWGYINAVGKMILPALYERAFGFRYGHASVYQNGTFYLINKSGKIVSQGYESGDPQEGITAVYKVTPGGDTLTGYIDTLGNLIIPHKFSSHAWGFYEGLALIKDPGRAYFIDKRGNRMFDTYFLTANPFKEGVAVVQTMSGTWGYLDHSGKVRLMPAYQYLDDYNKGYAVVVSSATRTYGLIDKMGNLVVPAKYRYISTAFPYTGHSLISVSYKGEGDEVFDNENGVYLNGSQPKNGYVDPAGNEYFFPSLHPKNTTVITNPPESVEGTFTDPRDGEIYPTKRIGTQVWMTKNLNYANQGSACYDNLPKNCTLYGRLYTLKAAMAAVPPGWHIPTKAEWDRLINYLGGLRIGGKMRAVSPLWSYPNTGATNSSGFNGLPGGNYFNGRFAYLWELGYWWSVTPGPMSPLQNTVGFGLRYGSDNSDTNAEVDNNSMLSVRCVKD